MNCFVLLSQKEAVFSVCFAVTRQMNLPFPRTKTSSPLAKPYSVFRNSFFGTSYFHFTAKASALHTILHVVLSASTLLAFGAVET